MYIEKGLRLVENNRMTALEHSFTLLEDSKYLQDSNYFYNSIKLKKIIKNIYKFRNKHLR